MAIHLVTRSALPSNKARFSTPANGTSNTLNSNALRNIASNELSGKTNDAHNEQSCHTATNVMSTQHSDGLATSNTPAENSSKPTTEDMPTATHVTSKYLSDSTVPSSTKQYGRVLWTTQTALLSANFHTSALDLCGLRFIRVFIVCVANR